MGKWQGSKCLLWAGAQFSSGYGLVWKDGKAQRAHRVAYEKEVGPIERDNVIMHMCDTPLCVNIKHLVQGTQGDNVADAVAKKRHKGRFNVRVFRGVENANAKFTAQEVERIRRLHAEGRGVRQLARDFGVSHTTIGNLVARKSYV